MIAKVTIAAWSAVLALTGCASAGQPPSEDARAQRYEVKDGSILTVDSNGRMRMFNPSGAPIYMKDGVAMELKDGTVITMKENAIWKELRLRHTLSPRG